MATVKKNIVCGLCLAVNWGDRGNRPYGHFGNLILGGMHCEDGTCGNYGEGYGRVFSVLSKHPWFRVKT